MRMQHKCFRPTANVTKEDKHQVKVQVRVRRKRKEEEQVTHVSGQCEWAMGDVNGQR